MVPCLVVSSDLFGQLELVNCSPIHRRRMKEKLKPRFDIGNLTFMYLIHTYMYEQVRAYSILRLLKNIITNMFFPYLIN